MAFTYEYKNTPVLSKTKIGDVVYYLKDAEARAALQAEIAKLGTAAYRAASDVVAANADLVSGNAVINYLSETMAEVAKALVFQGVADAESDFANNLVYIDGEQLVAAKGDVVLFGSKEYVFDGAKWIELGDEGIYLTKAEAANTYVKKTVTIAGIDLADNITAEELIAALNLKALAHKDSASGSISTIDEVKIANHTPAGSVSVELSHASTAMSSTGTFTPAGTVAGSTTAVGTVTIARDDAGVAVSGTVSAPTVTITPSTAEVKHINSVGTLPSYTAAQYTAPSVNESKSAFAAEGVTASIDADDAEMLVFAPAAKADAVIGTGFNAGSYTAAEFNAGSLPTLGESQTVMVGIASATASAPIFTGDKFGATFAGQEAAIAATFSGSEGNIAVSGNYDKAGVKSATFTGAEASVSVELVKSAKTVTVS